MIPVTPAFLVLVCVGVFAIASWAGAWRVLVAVVLVAGLAAIEVRFDLAPPPCDAPHRRRRRRRRGAARACGHRALRLDRDERRELLGVRLRAPGEPPRPSRRPARPVPHSRRRRGVRAISGRSCRPRSGATGCGCSTRRRPRRPRQRRRRSGRARSAATTSQCGRAAPLAPRALVREGVRLRLAWKRAVPFNSRVDELLIADRSALAEHACRTAISAIPASRRTGRR